MMQTLEMFTLEASVCDGAFHDRRAGDLGDVVTPRPHRASVVAGSVPRSSNSCSPLPTAE